MIFTYWLCTHISSLQVNLIITLSLGSIETDRVISEPCYNEIRFYGHSSKVINLGAMTWSCYIENRIIMRVVIMRLQVYKSCS